jgi:hypothetical protein
VAIDFVAQRHQVPRLNCGSQSETFERGSPTHLHLLLLRHAMLTTWFTADSAMLLIGSPLW